MTARWGGPPMEEPAVLESSSWQLTLALVLAVLMLTAALGAGVAG